ncbi:MAG: alkyl sulfatase dimerization domain-containing protein, partial [Bacteroidota bacterium]
VALPISTEVSTFTQRAHQDIQSYLPFGDSTDFSNATRGFIATRENPVIKTTDGNLCYDLSAYDFVKGNAPETVNPSLWRKAKLNKLHGLFQVTEKIYQVRGFDLANMSIVETDNGRIIIDPLTTFETAQAAMELVNEQLGEKKIQAVILTHTHVDHFGGIRAVVKEQDVKEGKVMVIAPEGFGEHAVSENVIAGNTMQRRGIFMFGATLNMDAKGLVSNGLGQNVANGHMGYIAPNTIIRQTGEQLNIDGVKIVFQVTPEAEAPAEFMFYFPEWKTFCQAEEINQTLHNLYTPRGAHVRNGLKWSKYIDEAIVEFGDEVEVSFGSHHFPTWGNESILKLWKGQRDTYKYIHDETLHLANKGYTMLEIAELVKLPDALAQQFANRDYYGTVNHNSKAQYQLYFGWFDANPANLHALPPKEASVKYVEYMGGADSLMAKAKQDFKQGAYRWVASVLNHLVFAQPDHEPARELLAQTYTQLGYQAESGPWRNFYLTGARELLLGLRTNKFENNMEEYSKDILLNIPLSLFYDYLAVRLDRAQAKGKQYIFNMIFP